MTVTRFQPLQCPKEFKVRTHQHFKMFHYKHCISPCYQNMIFKGTKCLSSVRDLDIVQITLRKDLATSTRHSEQLFLVSKKNSVSTAVNACIRIIFPSDLGMFKWPWLGLGALSMLLWYTRISPSFAVNIWPRQRLYTILYVTLTLF